MEAILGRTVYMEEQKDGSTPITAMISSTWTFKMHMRKRIAVALLALFLVALTSCSPDSSKDVGTLYCSNGNTDRELTIGVIGINNIEGYVARFNQSAKRDFSIRIVDYLGNGTREAAIARLNADLAAGQGPDIIDFDTVTSRDIYARHGLLRDMSDYFYREFQLDEFYVLDQLNKTNSLFFFPSHFCIITAVGHPSIFGNRNSWSIDDYAHLSRLPQFSDTPADTRESFLEKLHTSMIPRWVDLEQGISRFDNGEFSNALLFAKSLNDESYSFIDSPELMVAEGSLLYCEEWIYSPFDVCSIEQIMGGTAAYVGFPTPDGCLGSYLFTYGLTGVNAKTRNADIAWEFIRFLLVEDELIYDKAWIGIPVLKSAVEQKIEDLLHPYAEFEGKTIIVNEDGTFDVDGVHQDMTYDPTPLITEKQAETFYSLIQHSNCVYELDPKLYELMLNVSYRYFSGACTAEEAGKELQVRVNVYLSEQYG